MIKGILFDFDGVVVKSEDLHRKTFFELLAPYNVPDVSTDRWYKEFAGTGSRHIFEVLVKEHNLDLDVSKLVSERKKLYESKVRSGELKETPGILEFLELLRADRIKTAIVSGSHRTNVELALSVFDLNQYFDVIISGDDLKERKPDPKPFLYGAEKLGLTPNECIGIEDSYSGAESLRRGGIKLVVVNSPALSFVGKYDLLIDDFTGAQKLLEKMQKI